jgi:hypothetical protein
VEDTIIKALASGSEVMVMIIVLWRVTKDVLSVIRLNTEALSKLSEIVSHCRSNTERTRKDD